jgi:hypothetical protein
VNTLTAVRTDAVEGRLELTRGGSHITIRTAEIDELLRAEFGGVAPTARVKGGHVTIAYPRFSAAELVPDSAQRAEIELCGGLPWSIAFRGSLGDSSVDLRGVDLRDFEVEGGAGELRVLLPPPSGHVRVVIGGGASNVTLLHPEDTAVRLRIAGGASKLAFDRRRVDTRGGETRLETPGAGSATDRYEIEIRGGARGLTVAALER